MKRLLMRSVIVVFALCFISVSAVQASELTFGFPSIGAYYFSATNGSGFVSNYGPMPWMWTAGDFVTQTYFNGPAVADSASFDFYVKSVLNGYAEDWTVFINGVAVAYFFPPDEGGKLTILHYTGIATFAPIDGGGIYNYSFVLQNTIPTGGGSVAFYATPEPGSIALFGSGILGLAGVLRRKFRV